MKPKPRDIRGAPLWRKLALKLRAVRDAVGVTDAIMAKQLGISKQMLEEVLYRGCMPPPQLAARMKRWAFERVSWENSPSLRTREKLAKAHKWPGWRQTMPRPLMDRMDQKAAQLGMSRAAFAHIAIERLLDDTPALTVFKQACGVVERARIRQLLDENPDLADLLKSDIKLIQIVWGETPTRYADAVTTTHDVEELADMVVQDGPAQRIAGRDLEPV